ncbi:toluene tolerance protein [Methylophaga lonarensis MPL]|uniref:Toluene tolerance protein n=3 Tax=Methylophaga lonarensis TaxID=999151 RepID=M7P0X3_9GAMM|nr:ABC transporter substrate-binding protein [Methylophaga lonarensis]EMR13136.1 toluene tolerance protein [Methylophaga lonarensis MPL]
MMNTSISNSFKWLLAALVMLSMSIFASVSQASDDLVEPQLIVKTASEKVLAVLLDRREELAKDHQQIYDLVEEVVLPHFDFARMSRLALGRNWNEASPEQREQFVEEFRLLLVRTYATAMLEYTDEELRFLPFRDDLDSGRVNVPMQVIQSSRPPVSVNLALYKNKDGEWKVYDVRIEGISLVTNYRSTFANEIRNGGIEALIQSLSERNERIRS